MILISNCKAAKDIALKNNLKLINFQQKDFLDGSSEIILNDINIIENEVFIYYEFTMPFDKSSFNLLRLINLIKPKAKIQAIITPFMPFLREHNLNTFSLFDFKIIVLDSHVQNKKIFSELPNFKKYIEKDDLITLPDKGAIRYAKLYDNEYICGEKNRENGIFFKEYSKINQRNCVILDDILDTGYSLKQTIKTLKENGCCKIKAFISHFLDRNQFKKDEFQELGLDYLYICNRVLVENCKQEESDLLVQTVDFSYVFSDIRSKI